MQLVVIRHAIAMEREEFAPTGRDDSLRPLTDKGKAKMKKAGTAILPFSAGRAPGVEELGDFLVEGCKRCRLFQVADAHAVGSKNGRRGDGGPCVQLS